jgi:hypothetical protein
MEFLIAKTYANYLEEHGNEAASAIVVATNLRARTILRSEEICSFFAEILLEGSTGDTKRFGRDLYTRIVVKPAERSRIPRIVRDWVILMLVLTKAVSNPLQASKEPSLKTLRRLSTLLILMFSMLTIFIFLIQSDIHHFRVTDIHRQSTSLVWAAFFFAVGALQSFAFRYFRTTELLMNITLWLACCEVLGLTSAEIGDGYPGSFVLKTLVNLNQAKDKN